MSALRAWSPTFCVPQYTRQRISKPDYGLREAIMLPWYKDLADQYMASPYGTPSTVMGAAVCDLATTPVSWLAVAIVC